MQVWLAIDSIGSRLSRQSWGGVQAIAIPYSLTRPFGGGRGNGLVRLHFFSPLAALVTGTTRKTRRQSQPEAVASDLFALGH